jgi:hypothetical protein
MDTKTLVNALKTAVREVIKEELTDILKEGLQSTITEMKSNSKPNVNTSQPVTHSQKPNVQFTENRWSSVLNETMPLSEPKPSAMNSFSDLMNEQHTDTITMTSKDALGFGHMRTPTTSANLIQSRMEDPETGKVYDVAPEVAKAINRDYTALMKKITQQK